MIAVAAVSTVVQFLFFFFSSDELRTVLCTFLGEYFREKSASTPQCPRRRKVPGYILYVYPTQEARYEMASEENNLPLIW